MTPAPQGLTLKTHRDRKNWWQSVWIRRVLLLIPAAVVSGDFYDFIPISDNILGLAIAFGTQIANVLLNPAYAPGEHGRVGGRGSQGRTGLVQLGRLEVPEPGLAGLVTADHRMAGVPEVAGGVLGG